MNPLTHPTANLNRLKVALDANAAAYRRAVQSGAPGECWDLVVLTAANEKQAEGYRQELALRTRAVGPTGSFFPAIQRSVVIADPPGRRAGSGGATFAVLRELIRQFNLREADLDRLHILLIHSGGASQRLPAYSSLGKIFAPLPLLRPDGQIATLFDHLYLTLAGLPDRLGPGMLVLAGDVFLLFDHRQVLPPSSGVTALSMRVNADLGRGHGVFVTDSSAAITQTLQKVSVETMTQADAIDTHGRVLIDTGLLFFDSTRVNSLAKLAGGHFADQRAKKSKTGIDQRYRQQIDLYDDITGALASSTQRKDFVAGESHQLRGELFKALHGVPFQAAELQGEFLHLGTTRQFRDAMVGQNPSPAAELFQQNVLARSDWHLDGGRRVYHSVLLSDYDRLGVLGEGSVIEHSLVRAPSTIGNGSVVSQVVAVACPIELGDDLLLFQVPIRDKSKATAFVHVLCGVEDDFKGKFAQGKCVYLNQPIERWLERHKVKPDEIWRRVPANQRTLWNAKLFIATPQRDAANAAVRYINGGASKKVVNSWRNSPRYSMAEILDRADPVALIEHREVISAYLQVNELLESIRRREDKPLASFVRHFSTAAAYDAGEMLLDDWARPSTDDTNVAIQQARAFWCIAQLLQRPDHPASADGRFRIDDYMDRAFAKVAEASEIGHGSIRVVDSNGHKLKPGIEIVATSPVRLDLAGGWSDTPPYCFEMGGHVVNVAINLDNRPPVRAIVRTIAEPKLIIESHDLGRTIDLTETKDPESIDIRDPFALTKVALGITGYFPNPRSREPSGSAAGGSRAKEKFPSQERPGGRAARLSAAQSPSLVQHLKSLGVGLHITTECRVPKGSGLGTSSILAATLLAALHKARGRAASLVDLVEQTLLLEQRLSAGGGWQDQIGGIFGGVKSIVTAAGVPQRPVVESLSLSDAQYERLQDCLVVYFSGQQRLARDILRRVMGRWLAREPAMVLLEQELKDGAETLRKALLKGQWPIVAQEISRYWRIKKDLYPGSTTPGIDVLLMELKEHYIAASLAGAGGGGFGYFLCKSARQAAQLRERLAELSSRPGSLGTVYPTQINRTGLVVAANAI
jgi:fucokinase